MALLLRVAKKGRATAAMALVGGRGVASSAVDSAAGRALATLDHVPKVIKFAALPPAAVDRQDAGAKPGVEKAKGSAFQCDGAPGRAAVARDQVPGAQLLGLGLKPGLAQILAPSGKLKLGAGGGGLPYSSSAISSGGGGEVQPSRVAADNCRCGSPHLWDKGRVAVPGAAGGVEGDGGRLPRADEDNRGCNQSAHSRVSVEQEAAQGPPTSVPSLPCLCFCSGCSLHSGDWIL